MPIAIGRQSSFRDAANRTDRWFSGWRSSSARCGVGGGTRKRSGGFPPPSNQIPCLRFQIPCSAEQFPCSISQGISPLAGNFARSDKDISLLRGVTAAYSAPIRENSLFFPCLTRYSPETGSPSPPSTTTSPRRFPRLSDRSPEVPGFRRFPPHLGRKGWLRDGCLGAFPAKPAKRLGLPSIDIDLLCED